MLHPNFAIFDIDVDRAVMDAITIAFPSCPHNLIVIVGVITDQLTFYL